MRDTGIPDEALRETFLSSESVYPGKIIKVEKWQVTLPNGGTALRDAIRARYAAHPRVLRLELGLNPGETDLVLREF